MTSDPLQRWIDAGLYDPATDSSDRRALLAWFDEVGFDPEAFHGVPSAELPYHVTDRTLRPGRRLDRAEVQQASGLSPEDFARVARAAGFRVEDDFTEADLEVIGAFTAGSAMFSEAEVLHFVRVLSSAMARVADAATALFRIDVGADLEARSGSDLEWAKTNYEAAQLGELLLGALRALLLRQLHLSAQLSDRGRQRIGPTENASTLKLAVAFVDLVGYTPIAEALGPDELGRFVRAFEAAAYEIVSDNNGRLVKLIGDEVMFVSVDPGDACTIAQALIAAFDAEPATPRGGIAYGELVARGGDYYGRVVNMASRLADLAVAGEVLVDEATAIAVGPSELEPAGRRQLKGFADPVTLFSLDPAG